jgi:hypothetical protein
MLSPGQRLERIMTPGELLITKPRVQEFHAHTLGHTLFLKSICASDALWTINRQRVCHD